MKLASWAHGDAREGAAAPANEVLIAYASQSGFAERIAWRTAEAVQAHGAATRLTTLGALAFADLETAARALFIVSTTGEGEAPDSARAFARAMAKRKARLRALDYALLALGDSSHENFCAFGAALERWLRKCGAKPMAGAVRVDNGDPGALDRWRETLAELGLAAPDADWPAPRLLAMRLAARTWLNPGSPGAPLHHIALAPLGTPPTWEAGDIAEIYPGPAEQAFRGAAHTPFRDYSVASIPEDGRLDLAVREMRFPDGGIGPASRWLAHEAPLGARIALRLRANSTFHAPDADIPLLLVGAGSGVAGLRGHLKARARAGRARNWLIFGERTRAHDQHFGDELAAWRRAGVLARCDLAFSRDEAEPVYVQHILRQAAEQVRAWTADGAAIYVCGAAAGMARGVDDALSDILGAHGLERLAESGRYRRDVY